MGTSALPSPCAPPSPFTDWLNSDYLLTQAELTSTSGSSSSSSSSPALDSADIRPFLHSNPGFHCRAQTPLRQVGSPVISCNSISKEKPESPFIASCVSSMSNLSSATTHSSAPQHFQRGFNQLGNSIFKPTEENSPSCITSLLSAADAAASVALASSRSLGSGATKVSKRRSRANKKAPIAVLSADATNFRDMVQKLTGIPTSHVTPQSWGTSTAPLLRPQATRLGYNGALPTWDTSACFLSPKQMLPFLQRAPLPLMNGLLSRGAGGNGEGLAAYGGRCNIGNHGTYVSCNIDNHGTHVSHPSLPGLWDPVGSAKSVGNLPQGNVKELLATNVVRGGEQALRMNSSTLLERFLMSDEAQSPHSNVDSWLALDGGALTAQSTGLDGS